jgi:GT2 family glycosyltransferase
MDVSVIIVNYNVRYFLEPCLRSVEGASGGLDVEVIVVDNNSVDESVDMVKKQFPEVRLIVNDDNPGFSKANNQGIAVSRGKYVLLLNPDTLIEERTLAACFSFMEKTPAAGAVGVRMIDGSGQFLPESKRGFPGPWVAFCKATGLSRLFPRSKTFNRYHLGYLDEHAVNEVDVLTGAFMFLRREALEEVGHLDEDFFMYGEDIDLSYRLVQAGYKNYYLPETTIVHYKGESTKKGSLNYVVTFYRAMIIFARKHFSGRRRRSLVRLLNMAIYLRAGVTVVKNALKRLAWPVLDLAFIYLAFFTMEYIWSKSYHGSLDYYPVSNLWLNYPLYSLIFVLSGWLTGLYEKRFQWSVFMRSWFVATLIILALYALLPIDWRSSRPIILGGSALAGVYWLVSRLISRRRVTGRWQMTDADRQKLVVIGSREEVGRVRDLLGEAGVAYDYAGAIAPSQDKMEAGHVSHLGNLQEFVRIHGIDELVFCARDVPVREITHWMGVCGPKLAYKVIVEHASGIVGSRSKHTAGQLYTLDLSYRLADPVYRREKRIFDMVMGIVALLLSPVLIWWSGSVKGYFKRVFEVIAGSRTWVGYAPGEPDPEGLPPLKEGVLHPLLAFGSKEWTLEEVHHHNFLYARDFTIGKDLDIVVKCFSYIGKNNI